MMITPQIRWGVCVAALPARMAADRCCARAGTRCYALTGAAAAAAAAARRLRASDRCGCCYGALLLQRMGTELTDYD